ncbi:carbohydrate ABC transporter permease [Thermoanaerobacterium thermosulfurigenes]|uniref:carbohydrate ABC transporter permease n=1 Tax=Thermoanaerobacterium thermosulfurigenes TaxID=33950 RepID=UPI003F4A2B0E
MIIALFPLLWLVITSFKSTGEILSIPPTILPKKFTFESYYEIWWKQPFKIYILNSLKISILSTLISIFVASLAGYGFAVIKFPFKKFLIMLVLIAQMFPGTSIIIPIFDLFKRLGLYDNHLGLILMYGTITLPFSIWMLYGYFRNIPKELHEAAIIDGCSHFGIFTKIVLPMARPGIAAVGVYSFLSAWNEYLYGLILISTETKYVISVGLAHFITEFGTYWNQMSAGAVLVVIPTIIMFIILGKNLIEGLTAGAVKG